MRRALLLPALVVALIVGCDGGAPVEPTRPVHVTSVDTLRPGQIGHVRGSGLKNLRSLLLDGVAATELVARSDSVAEFRVPSMRACETDMRAVKVSAEGSAPIGAIVRVPPSVSLRPAESRVLTQDDLRCLRLPAADEDYVLSAANLAIPTAGVEFERMLVSVRLLGTGDATASTLASADARGSLAPFSARGAGTPLEPAMPERAALTGKYSQAPVPFDPRYATAVAGDTLRFVDWYSGRPDICHQPAESVPSFQAKVVAVSGQVAVVVDLRHPSAAAYLDPAKLGWLRDAAAMTDRWLLPTMRSVFDADYLPPAGGGGRFYLLLGFMPAAFQSFAGYAYDGPLPTVNVASQASCPRASEMVVSLLNPDWFAQPQYQNANWAAGLFLHEYAHNADLLTSRRGRIAGILGEGLATLAEETASRIASGQPLHARHSGVGSDAPAGVHGGAHGMWGTRPELGPWQHNGRYGANARMLLFLRELAGEASVDHGRRPTLYQRLIYAPIDWNNRPAVIAHITSVLGVDYADLIDRQTLASVTAGLIDPGVVHELPRYTSWDHSERARLSGPLSGGFPGRPSRRVGGEHTLAAADGGHAALYLMGDGPRGISLELVSMAPTARIVRLTRLR
ncbi:MAG TPA: hypothetical protein VGR37_18320 [Longimicrobiaceae bacterium]|nr:hypothetical protein [Longimicrobiaceae bacterium]